MASPAQIANDMEARARFWSKRDKDVAFACRDAARVIRGYVFGPAPDGRTVTGVLTRLHRLLYERFRALGSADQEMALQRAADAIAELRNEARGS